MNFFWKRFTATVTHFLSFYQSLIGCIEVYEFFFFKCLVTCPSPQYLNTVQKYFNWVIYSINVSHSHSNPLSGEAFFSCYAVSFHRMLDHVCLICLNWLHVSSYLQTNPDKFTIIQTDFTFFLFTCCTIWFYLFGKCILPEKQSNLLQYQIAG